jgi:hypothetical protein
LVKARDDPQRVIEEKLQQAIDTLRADATRVELWASALSGFARPVPGYDFEERYGLKKAPNVPAKSD